MCFYRYYVSLSQVRYEHPHQKRSTPKGCFFFGIWAGPNRLNAARMSAAGDGWTEPNND